VGATTPKRAQPRHSTAREGRALPSVADGRARACVEALGAGIGARAWLRRAPGSAGNWSTALGQGLPGQSVRGCPGVGEERGAVVVRSGLGGVPAPARIGARRHEELFEIAC
jgi:hypothetical protein